MNLLITGAWTCSKYQLDTITQMGHSICFMQHEQDNLPCNPKWIEGVICNSLFLHHDIRTFKNLCFIQTTSSGLDRIPLDYCSDNKIVVKNARGVYSIPMAEYTICGVLDIYKRTHRLLELQKSHVWEKQRDLIELSGKEVCIVGCGNVGHECARRFKSFGCLVNGVDLETSVDILFNHIYRFEEIDKAICNADIVILTCPLTDKTHGLFDKSMFKIMKEGSLICNIARGSIINHLDLIDALKNKLGGAVLDVFENEPLDRESELWSLENVIITPHISFVGNGNSERLFNLIRENLGSLK